MEGITHVPISSRELLWENQNPTSTFPEQTITIGCDLRAYSEIEIRCCLLSSSVKGSFFGEAGDLIQLFATNNNYTDTNSGGYRYATLKQDSIVFGTSYYNNSLGNGYFVPLKIYGIR